MVCLHFVESPSGYSYNDIGLLAAYRNPLAIVTVSKSALFTSTLASAETTAVE
jgi:hypothetical protein